MGYDLLISTPRAMQIVSLPFFWLARMLARPAFWGADATYFSITRGRHDIIWRREIPQPERAGE